MSQTDTVADTRKGTATIGVEPEAISLVPTRAQVIESIRKAAVDANVICSGRDARRIITEFTTAYHVITSSGRTVGGYVLPRAFLGSNAYTVMEAIFVEGSVPVYGDGTALDLLSRHVIPQRGDVIGSFQHSAVFVGVRDYCTVQIVMDSVNL